MTPRISLLARQIAERRYGPLRMLGSNGGSETRDDRRAAIELAETPTIAEAVERKLKDRQDDAIR